jgi:histidyl-tRNA synthetase
LARIEPRVLKGFRDYLPEVMIPRQKMLATIEGIFQTFGFVPLMTPALEYAEILLGKYGDEGDQLLYRFQTRGDRDVALRYDLTVPLARVVAQYPEITLPFRRYQIAPVWRAEKPQRGRFREFVQCDGDIIGSAEMVADAEIVQLACALLEGLGVARYRVRLNNRKVLAGLMERIGVASGPAEAGVLRTIDKLPKIGAEEARRLLREENGLGGEQIAAAFEFLDMAGEADDVLRRLEAFFQGRGPGLEGTRELRQVFEILAAVGLTERAALDLSIARGLAYYTGTIYEAFLEDLPAVGAVMGGGRYDGLIGLFKDQEVPSVGISLGIDRLLAGLIELGVLETGRSVAQVLVTVFDGATAPAASRVAWNLRRGGVACELFPAPGKLAKQFRHAEREGLRWAVVVGPEEVAQGLVTVKDLETREQRSMPEAELVAYLSAASRS